MVQKAQVPYASLLVAAIVLIIAVFCDSPQRFALTSSSPPAHRLTYLWFHANIVHAIFNVWCLLAFVAVYELKTLPLLISIVITAGCPSVVLPEAPVVGMSGVCFALMGMAALKSRAFIKYNLYALSFISVGFLFPFVAAWLHLYCYVAGIAAGCVLYTIGKCNRR